MLDDELDLRRAREKAKQGLDKFAQKLKKSFGGGTPSKADLKKLEEAKLKHKEYIRFSHPIEQSIAYIIMNR